MIRMIAGIHHPGASRLRDGGIMRHLKLGLLCAVIVLAGCERRQRPAPPRPAPPPETVQPAISTAAYFATAASIDLLSIRASEHAMRHSADARTRQIAQMLLQDHRGTSSQLSMAGRRLNMLPSATLLPRHQALLTQLQASADMDSLYRRQMLAVHEEAVRLQDAYAERGDSPTLRPVAKSAATVERRHLERLRGL